MNVLFDTNVVLDVLLRPEPFFEDAAELFAHAELGSLRGYLATTTVTTLAYFMERTLRGSFRAELERLLELFDVAAVDQSVLIRAQRSPVADFEDAVLAEAALALGLDAVVTRNIKDFRDAPLRVFTPEALLAVIDASR